jgi:hypothetical protein
MKTKPQLKCLIENITVHDIIGNSELNGLWLYDKIDNSFVILSGDTYKQSGSGLIMVTGQRYYHDTDTSYGSNYTMKQLMKFANICKILTTNEIRLMKL